MLTVKDLENVNYKKGMSLFTNTTTISSCFYFFDGNILNDDFLASCSTPKSDAKENCR